jgi:hypothetical protein
LCALSEWMTQCARAGHPRVSVQIYLTKS